MAIFLFIFIILPQPPDLSGHGQLIILLFPTAMGRLQLVPFRTDPYYLLDFYLWPWLKSYNWNCWLVSIILTFCFTAPSVHGWRSTTSRWHWCYVHHPYSLLHFSILPWLGCYNLKVGLLLLLSSLLFASLLSMAMAWDLQPQGGTYVTFIIITHLPSLGMAGKLKQ